MSRNVIDDLLTPQERQAKREETARILAEVRETSAAMGKEERQPLPTKPMTLRDGPFQGLPPDPMAARKPIPGCRLAPFNQDFTKIIPTESEGT